MASPGRVARGSAWPRGARVDPLPSSLPEATTADELLASDEMPTAGIPAEEIRAALAERAAERAHTAHATLADLACEARDPREPMRRSWPIATVLAQLEAALEAGDHAAALERTRELRRLVLGPERKPRQPTSKPHAA